MRRFAVIVAGGSGTRMGTEIPKQFLKVAGKPIIFHTLERFYAFDHSIEFTVVLPQDHIAYFKSLKKEVGFDAIVKTVAGGETRFHSVKNGLSAINSKGGIVGIHDAVRPFVSIETLNRAYVGAEKNGNAIPAITLVESVRKVLNTGNQAVDRKLFKVIQTPQCFQLTLIKNAFQQNYKEAFTDDATVLESIGKNIHLVEGNRENIKITTKNDLLIAEAYLSN